MCLIFIAHRCDARYRLVVAANRDEFYSRPTAPAEFWADMPGVLAGRDKEAGGTWLGLTRGGRFAALTNFRNPARALTNPPSRGALVADFLAGEADVRGYNEALKANAHLYNGFGFLALSGGELGYFSNGDVPAQQVLAPGLYGLSNHLLDTPWPKLTNGKQAVRACLDDGVEVERLFEIMTNRDVPSDKHLPDTGVSRELERNYSPMFVSTETYGTRCTTVILIGEDNTASFFERTYSANGRALCTRTFSFQLVT